MKSRSKIQDNNGNGSPQDRQSIVVKTKPVVDLLWHMEIKIAQMHLMLK